MRISWNSVLIYDFNTCDDKTRSTTTLKIFGRLHNVYINHYPTVLLNTKLNNVGTVVVFRVHRRCDQKITVIFQFREFLMFDFFSLFLFFSYVGKHVCYICWQYEPFWIVSLFLIGKKISRILLMAFDFLLFKKMDQRSCIEFCVKNKIKCAKTFEMSSVAFGESCSPEHVNNRWKDWSSEENDSR